MAKKLFIAATGQHCGKTTISFALFHLLRSAGYKVGFCKPVGQVYLNCRGFDMDKDSAVIAEAFDLDLEDTPYLSPVIVKRGVTRDYIEGKIKYEDLKNKITEAVNFLDAKYDYLILEGTGHAGVGSVIGLNNAQTAKICGSPAILVTGAGIGNCIDRVHLNKNLFEQEGVDIAAVVPNKIIQMKREEILRLLGKNLGEINLKVCGGMNYTGELALPNFSQIARLFKKSISGQSRNSQKIFKNCFIGAASIQRTSELIEDESVIIVPGSRSEIIISLAALYQIPEYRNKICGLILSGVPEVSLISQKILKSSGVPHFTISTPSYKIFPKIMEYTSKLSAEDTHKIDALKKLSEEQLNIETFKSMFK